MTDIETRLDRAVVPLADAIAAGRVPGGVLGLVDRDGNCAVRAMGSAQLVPERRAMTEATWFDLASLTKVLFTTERILKLAETGRIDLDAPLTTVLPDFRQYNPDNWERKVTFRHCLGHQTPFPAVFPIYTYGRDPDLLRAFVLQHEWPAAGGLFGHQLHPARPRARAARRMRHPRDGCRSRLRLVGRSAGGGGHRGRYLAAPRALRRSA